MRPIGNWQLKKTRAQSSTSYPFKLNFIVFINKSFLLLIVHEFDIRIVL